jgi:hypothetical protein
MATNLGQIQTLRVNATSDGDNTVIAAPGANKRIRVLGYQLRFVGAGLAVTVKSGAAGTVHLDEVGAAAPGQRLDYTGTVDGQAFNCDPNAALVVNNAAGADTLGHVTYYVTDS